MASTPNAAAAVLSENNNPEKVATSAPVSEQNCPTELVGVATDAGNNTEPCSEQVVEATEVVSNLVTGNATAEEATSLESKHTTEESNPTSAGESISTSGESKPTNDMGNSSEKTGVNIELSAKASEQSEPVEQLPSNLIENSEQATSSGTSTQRAHPSSPNQKGRNVQFANNGHGNVETPVSGGPNKLSNEEFSAERPFVSTLGSQPERTPQNVQSATNGKPEEDGFLMRKPGLHGRSYSERGSGMLRGRTQSVIVNGSDDSTEFDVRRRSGSVLEVKEQAYTRLKEELHSAQLTGLSVVCGQRSVIDFMREDNAGRDSLIYWIHVKPWYIMYRSKNGFDPQLANIMELQLKDKECEKLSRIQGQMERELEDLTASLFEEANNMVQEANIKRMHTEKLLREANSKIEVLEAEVSALKTLVITSTPSMPNRHLHPQIDTKTTKGTEKFVKSHKRSTSHHDFKKEMETLEVITIDADIDPHQKNEENREIDPVYYQEFKTWKTNPGLDASHAFLQRIIHEDILPCLNFANQELSQDVFDSVRNNVLNVELIQGKNSFPRRCALLDTTKLCQYRIKLRDTGPWHFISQFARNRITTVCDFYTYIRYIQQGLVKSDESSIYWEIIRLRKQMAMARLGVMS